VTAAIISTSEPKRLYSGLSVLVSTAVDGEPCAVLLAFDGLEAFLSPLEAGDVDLMRSLRELRQTALDLDNMKLYACAASVEFAQVESDLSGLDGVLSTPRFLRDAAGERLLFI
jgi:peroxiredoxin family protein